MNKQEKHSLVGLIITVIIWLTIVAAVTVLCFPVCRACAAEPIGYSVDTMIGTNDWLPADTLVYITWVYADTAALHRLWKQWLQEYLWPHEPLGMDGDTAIGWNKPHSINAVPVKPDTAYARCIKRWGDPADGGHCGHEPAYLLWADIWWCSVCEKRVYPSEER